MTNAYQPYREPGEPAAVAGWVMSATTWGGRGRATDREHKPMSLSDAIALFALVLAAIRLGLDIPRKK